MESGVTPATLRRTGIDKKIGFKAQIHSREKKLRFFPRLSSFPVKGHVRQGVTVLHYTYTDLYWWKGRKPRLNRLRACARACVHCTKWQIFKYNMRISKQ